VKIKTAGATDLAALFQRSEILRAKLVHTPFLVFAEGADEIEVHIVDQASALAKYPRETKAMVQWRGEYRSDFFQMTVGDVLDAMETRIAGHDAALLRQATEVVLSVGPKGGFRHLGFTTPKGSVGIGSGFKAYADELIAFFQKNGIPIERRVRQ